ncbi:MAG TPA: reductase [Mycobacteriales bacterium]|jgi:2'-hydroxyisoflavone reductase|nr:reductase [Mycobacteriales bacterium]
MRLLVLGGTRFLGRGVVDAALAAGDQVTTFTRGTSGAPPSGVQALHGDRGRPDGMDVLRGREWDAVVDTSGYVPVVVGRGAQLLADAVGHYVFISSLNAYPDWPAKPIRSDSAVHDCEPDAGSPDGEFDPELYGPYKVGSERAVDVHFAGRSAHLRAGLIVGPYDLSGRFPYWVGRVDRGGELLAPGDPDNEVRVIDARDLGAWAVEVARTGTTGAFPVTGPAGQTTFGGMLAAMRDAAGSDAVPTWVDDDFLLEHQVQPWSELPMWIPAAAGAGIWDADTSAAERAGLTTRPIAETAADTLAWLRSRPEGPEGAADPRTGRAGLDPERETALLAAWHSG